MPLRAPALLALTAAFLLGLPTSGVAQPAKWDQERVTAIARELEDATRDLRRAMRREPPPSLGSTQANSWHRLVDRLRLIESETRHLARQLENGRGHDATLPIYQRLHGSIQTAREEARRTFIPQPVLDRASRANTALTKLAPYYDPNWGDQPGGQTQG